MTNCAHLSPAQLFYQFLLFKNNLLSAVSTRTATSEYLSINTRSCKYSTRTVTSVDKLWQKLLIGDVWTHTAATVRKETVSPFVEAFTDAFAQGQGADVLQSSPGALLLSTLCSASGTRLEVVGIALAPAVGELLAGGRLGVKEVPLHVHGTGSYGLGKVAGEREALRRRRCCRRCCRRSRLCCR